jgi:CPA1 family monovalent cation:H+ antiporter
MNKKGFQYIVGEDANGNETITVYNPDDLIDEKAEDGVAVMHNPEKVKVVKRLESPDNF